MKLKDDIFTEESKIDITLCKEMSRQIVVSEKIKKILFDAKVKGLEFSDGYDITPQDRTIYEKI